MITLDNLTFSADRKSLIISVDAGTNNSFEYIKFWLKDDFKNYSKSFDFSNKLTKNIQLEEITIDAEDIGLSNFNSVYFIEFTTDKGELFTKAIAELSTYEECKLDKIMKMIYSNEPCDSSMMNNIISIDMILNALKASIDYDFFDEIINLLKVLDQLCKNECSTCPK